MNYFKFIQIRYIYTSLLCLPFAGTAYDVTDNPLWTADSKWNVERVRKGLHYHLAIIHNITLAFINLLLLPSLLSLLPLPLSCGSFVVVVVVVTSFAKEVMFLVALVSLSVCLSVCLFVCLFVCEQHYSKSYERIGMKFYGRVLSSTRKNWLNFGGDLGIARWVNEQKNTVLVVAYPDHGAGNDPEPFFFFFFFLGGWVVFHNQGSTFLQWAIWE